MNKKISRKALNIFQIFLLVSPLLICILLFSLVPIFLTLQKSFKYFPYSHTKSIYTYNFGNYKSIFNDPQFHHAILNTTITTFIGSLSAMLFALMFAILIEHIISKTAKTAFLTLIYSQFFISSFAVGIAFTVFFGSKGLFYKLIGTQYHFTYGEKRLPIWVYYSLFQFWRALPFNLVLFASAINRANLKYSKLIKNDKLTLLQKIKFIYANEIEKVFFVILFTNFIFATLLLPDAILESSFDVDLNHAHTLTSYSIKYSGGGSNPSLKYEKGYAAAFFSFIYLVFLMFIILVLRPSFIKKIIIFVQKYKAKSRRKNEC